MFDLARRWLPLLLLVATSFTATHLVTEWWTARSTRLVSPPLVTIPALAGTTSARQHGDPSQTAEIQRSERPSGTNSPSSQRAGREPSTRTSPTSSSSEPGGAGDTPTDAAPDEPYTLDPIPGAELDPSPDDEEPADVP